VTTPAATATVIAHAPSDGRMSDYRFKHAG
jgi:hypothetical protein